MPLRGTVRVARVSADKRTYGGKAIKMLGGHKASEPNENAGIACLERRLVALGGQRKVARWFSGVLVSDLSLPLLGMVYTDPREERGTSQHGVHKLNAVISQVMDLVAKERLVEHNPCRDVEVARPCPGTKLVEREVVRDGRGALVEEWRIAVPSVAELLEIQRGAGASIAIDGVESPSW